MKLPDIHAANGTDMSKVHPDSSSANLQQKKETNTRSNESMKDNDNLKEKKVKLLKNYMLMDDEDLLR